MKFNYVDKEKERQELIETEAEKQAQLLIKQIECTLEDKYVQSNGTVKTRYEFLNIPYHIAFKALQKTERYFSQHGWAIFLRNYSGIGIFEIDITRATVTGWRKILNWVKKTPLTG
jgi:hypothetical protein